MSRFRVVPRKGAYYVLTDTGAVAGGPFEFDDEAAKAVDKLVALEAAKAARANQPEAHKLNITPGYRSPDVEDGRGDKGPSIASARMLPPGWVKLNTPPVPDWKRHNIPIDPVDLADLDKQFNEWMRKGGPTPGPTPPAVRMPPPGYTMLPPWAVPPVGGKEK